MRALARATKATQKIDYFGTGNGSNVDEDEEGDHEDGSKGGGGGGDDVERRVAGSSSRRRGSSQRVSSQQSRLVADAAKQSGEWVCGWVGDR